ncbi:MAG: hypothetical protein ACR2FN_11660 [Chitinophagaceae bacterium]
MKHADVKQHWENIYETNKENEFSWFQKYPKTSIEFLNLFRLPKTANIIDVGGEDSHFVDALIEEEYKQLRAIIAH